MEPDGTYTTTGAITTSGGYSMPFSGTVTISPHKPSWWQRLLAWLRSFPR